MAAPRRRRAAAVAVLLVAAALAAAIAPRGAHAALTSIQAGEWRAYMQETAETEVNGQPLSSTLKPGALSHPYSTPLDGVLAANVNAGGSARLRRVARDLLAGKQVTVLALGGPATNGSDASVHGRTDYFAQYVGYLARAFPSADLKPYRAAVGVAPSAVVVGCLDRYLPAASADLILLDMASNDGLTMDSAIANPGQPKAYEMLVRKLLDGEKQPAVILTQTMPAGMGNASRPFYSTPESPHYAAVAGYYGTPVVSMRNALWPGGYHHPSGLMSTPAVSPADGSTPNDAGHAAIADALVFATQRAALDLQLLPFGEWDAKSLDGDVPRRPMFAGLDAPEKTLTSAVCAWVRNATVSPSGGCPTDLAAMCKVDYSSLPAARRSYADLRIPELDAVQGEDGHLHLTRKQAVSLVGGIVGGVVAGVAVLAGLAVWAVMHRRRKAAEADAAFQARLEAKRSGGGGGGNGGAGGNGGKPAAAPAVTRTGGPAPVDVTANARV